MSLENFEDGAPPILSGSLFDGCGTIIDRHLAEMPVAFFGSRKTGRYTFRHAGHAGRGAFQNVLQ